MWLGLDPEAFWRATPRLIALTVEARTERYERDVEVAHDRNAWLAWHVAALMRMPASKRLPKLDAMLYRRRRRRAAPQTPEQMFAMVKMLNAAYGGSVAPHDV